jgi:hypothetical protein
LQVVPGFCRKIIEDRFFAHCFQLITTWHSALCNICSWIIVLR